ncbi:MAG: PIG-L family deacetylase [Planctomycetia bacterium]|nr:PIG-L family deacetylase [Planctomycetia bacterium]
MLITQENERAARQKFPPAVMIAVVFAAALAGAHGLHAQVAVAEREYTGDDRIEKWAGKTVLAVTPHPDDETFSAGGLLAMLAAKGNNVQILIYTSDNAGSNDPAMTKERLADIRRREEEDACAILGIPKDHITWLGYDDGMLEYVDRRELTKQVAREIRRHRPDAVLSIDPGAPYEQWHKSDHRSGAVITADAMRAAGWRLYFPELEREGFKQHKVPVAFFYYSAQPNYAVDITDQLSLKARAAAAHTSQFGAMVDHYDDSNLEEQRAKLTKSLQASPLIKRKNGRVVEEFRRSTAYGG